MNSGTTNNINNQLVGKLDEVELEQFHLIQLTGRQHRQCIIPQAVNTV